MSDTPDIRALTEAYVTAFDAADLDAVAALMHPEVSLTDPGVLNLAPRQAVLDFVGGIFASVNGDVSFTARTILVDGLRSAIEFELRLGETELEGIDLIEWDEAGRMLALRAHLTDKASR